MIKFKFVSLSILILIGISACGIKPKELKAPSEDSVFPRIYPAPDPSDTKPKAENAEAMPDGAEGKSQETLSQETVQ